VAEPWFSLVTLVSSTNKTYCHDIAEILLKVALNTITLTPTLTPTDKLNQTRMLEIKLTNMNGQRH
jgi:hypothetical protein